MHKPIKILANGYPGCLDGETFVKYQIRDNKGKIVNSKGGKISTLFKRFNSLDYHCPKKRRIDVKFYAPSVNNNNIVFQNEIIGVVDSGIKDCWEVKTEDNQTITATKDHRFYDGESYVKLSKLNIGNTVFVHTNNIPKKNTKTKRINNRNFLYVKYHPVCRRKTIKGKYVRMSKDYSYHVVPKSRAVVEANENNITIEEYKHNLNNNNYDNMKFYDGKLEFHHKNGNYKNDSVGNISVLTKPEHSRVHSTETKILRYRASASTIKSIKYVGKKHTYDIQMKEPYHNFIANKFVVHNSGKTHFALTFPKTYWITNEPGNTVLLDSNPELAKNVVATHEAIPSPLVDIKDCVSMRSYNKANKPEMMSTLDKHIFSAHKGHNEGKVETLVFDNISFYSENYWLYLNQYKIQRGKNGEIDARSMYGDLGRHMYEFTLFYLLSFPGNVVATCHEQVESEDGMQKKVDKTTPIVSNILGGFRDKVGGMFGASIFLKKKRKGENQYEYSARCQKGEMREAKNRLGLPETVQNISYQSIVNNLKGGK